MAKKKKKSKEKKVTLVPVTTPLQWGGFKRATKGVGEARTKVRQAQTMFGFESTARRALERQTSPIVFKTSKGKELVYARYGKLAEEGKPITKKVRKTIEKKIAISRESEEQARDKLSKAIETLREKEEKKKEEGKKLKKEVYARTGKVISKGREDVEKWSRKKAVSKRVLKQQPRGTLDLRQRQIESVRQHGFKEQEISNTNFLFG